jgi:hypothetical protein
VIVHNIRDLTLWRTELPSVEHAILPPSTQRPNPRIEGRLLFISIFSPGAIHALDRFTGNIVWSREITPFAGEAVESANGLLLVQSPHTLFALDPSTGQTRWEFCPHGTEGESIYSSVIFHRNKLFMGDRAGDFHCLDPATGASIWSQRATANGGDVNSTALGWGDLIFVGTNERTVVAFEEATGTLVWRKTLDGPCTQELQRFRDCIAVATDSLTLFDPATGEQATSWSWPGERVWSMTVAGRNMLLNLSTKEEGSRKDRFVWTRNNHSPEEGWLGDGFPSNLRYDSLHDLIYASSFSALSVVAPGTREIKYRMEADPETLFGALPDATDDVLYLLDQSGSVSALRLSL